MPFAQAPVVRAARQFASRGLSARIRALPSWARSAVRSARFVAVTTRKPLGRPEVSALTAFGIKTRSVSIPSGPNCAAGREAAAGDAIWSRRNKFDRDPVVAVAEAGGLGAVVEH